jgi:hypothetical protein
MKNSKRYSVQLELVAGVSASETKDILRRAGCRLEHGPDWLAAREDARLLSMSGGVRSATVVSIVTTTTRTELETYVERRLVGRLGKPYHQHSRSKKK